jgi:DNA (cytosine-5)-methyltransferase 1
VATYEQFPVPGLAGERSGLWYEMHRVISELRPEIVLAENVAALRNRGLLDELRGLDSIGYDASWQTLSAQEVGAIHLRQRLWITAIRRDADCDAVRKHIELSKIRRNVVNWPQPERQAIGPLSRADWSAIQATRLVAGEPLVSRVPHGLSERVHRIRALGNAIVPQCAARVLREWLMLSA